MKEEQFIKGFNQGYVFQKERPALARQIVDSFQDSQKEYGQGFIAGSKQFEHDRVKAILKERSDYNQQNDFERER